MSASYSVSIKLVQGLLAAAAQADLPMHSLLAAAGLSADEVANADDRLPHGRFVALWQEIARQSQDPAIGLHLALMTQLETFNVTGYAMSHSPTLGKALQRLIRYSRLLYEGMVFTLKIEPEQATLSYGVVNAALPLPVASIDWTLAHIVTWAERSLGCPLPLLQATLVRADPTDPAVYQHMFQTKVAFGATANTLSFPPDWLDQPLPNADSGLCDLLDRYAESMLAMLPASDSFIAHLQHLIAQQLRGQEPKLEAIAARMGYAPRTLQRKLQQAGTSFQQLSDDIRQTLACQYLQETRLTTSEIAFVLGFSENSAFSRAFRRWTNFTPTEYRRRHQHRDLSPETD